MRFRISDYDVAMPPALVAYWTAWNEADPSRLRHHLMRAVTVDVEWNDPRDSFRGIDALEANMAGLRESKPEYRFRITSEIDGHNRRLRYRWSMVRGTRVLMEGVDVVTLQPETGLIERVDGFFGEPSPLLDIGSGVPAELRGRG